MDVIAADLVEAYASVFVHCWSQYAVQQRDGSYWRVREPLTLPLLSAHLAGRCTLGTYLLDESSHCAFAVFDADSGDGLGRLVGLAMDLAQQGIPTVLEASRRGGHLWVHLAEPTPAHLVRAWLLPSAQSLGVELYPKQDTLGPDGACSLIRLPLGIHRQARGWYPFVQMNEGGDVGPVGETVWECCAWVCQHVQRVALPAAVLTMDMTPSPLFERNMPLMASHEGLSRSGRGSIRAWCCARDIIEVIGRFVALDHRGVGSCPFKEHHYRGDLRPSFQVFGGNDPHWYCYTWGRAGDLFDFVCLYYHLSPQEAWQRIQAGWQF
jgi:CHC2 zinc finger